MIKKNTALLICTIALAGCAVQTGATALDRQRCIRIYVQGLYSYRQVIHHPRSYLPPRGSWDETRDGVDGQDVRLGAGFAIHQGSRTLLATAAHLFPAPQEVDGVVKAHVTEGDVTVAGSRTKIRVSALAFTPTRLCVDRESDVALLEMPSAFWRTADMQIYDLNQAVLARLTSPVQVWGFPSTPVPQIEPQIVASASRQLVMLNQPSDPGFSGGPVVDADTQQLVGIVLRTSGAQTACLPAAMVKDLTGRFEQTANAYVEP